jgi:hypothetical protein
LAKIGLKMKDLYPAHKGGREIEAIYEYLDATGELVHQKIRYRGKKFIQRRPDGDGGWAWGLRAGWYRKEGDGWHPVKDARDPKNQPSSEARWFPETPKLLYRLTQVVAATKRGEIVLMVEGEKDSDNAAQIGLQATTAGGAAEPWQDSFGEALRGAKLVFIPDADDAGRKLFEKYAPNLARYVAELRRLDLPDGFKDLSDWLGAGHTRDELDVLIAAAPVWDPRGPAAEILDAAPETIRRPLCIVSGRGHLATWVHLRAGGEDAVKLVILREDGALFADDNVPGALPSSELGVAVRLDHVPHFDSVMSGAAVKRYIAGERPDPGEVFGRVRTVVEHFMDFGHSVGTQSDLVDLVALYIMASYLLDAFTVVGYLWPNGDKGVGKTKLLVVVTDLACMGVLVTAGGTFASLRDLADYGATIAFDDSESIMDLRRADPDKRTLLLAGNRRGAYVTLKEPLGDGWTTRYVHAFCMRCFSAINLPDETLASRTIVVPLVRSADNTKANRDPADHEVWPVDRRRLVDDLWSLGLANLTTVRTYDRRVPGRVQLVGRNLEPWRAILAVALWLQKTDGVARLFDRIANLAVHYQVERGDIEEASPVRILLTALQRMMKASTAGTVEFTPTELATAMNTIATADDVDHSGDSFTNARKVGRLLQRLRVTHLPRAAGSRRCRMSGEDLDALARAYGMPGISGEHDVSDNSDVHDVLQDSLSATDTNVITATATTPAANDLKWSAT